MTLEEIVSAKASHAGIALVDRFCQERDSYGDLSFALLAHFADRLGAEQEPPLLAQLADRYAGYRPGYNQSVLDQLWASFFLPALAGFGLAQGETEGIVISPSGMLHSREPKSERSDCGKEVNGKWLQQFHRGGNVHQLYRFNHPKLCSTCFSGYDLKLYRGKDLSVSKQDYPQPRAESKALLRQSLCQALNGPLGAQIRQQFPLTDALLANAVQIAESVQSSWHKRREIALKCFGNRYMQNLLRQEFLALDKERGTAVRELLAAHLAELVLAAPRGQVALFLLTPYGAQSRMPSLGDFALQSYGSFDAVALPNRDELAEIIAVEKIGVYSGQGGHNDLIENVVLPKLLVGCWHETLLPLVVAAYPEETKGLPLSLQIAYRMMAGRQAPHTNGTRKLDLAALYEALDSKRCQYGMPWESVAAELRLPVESLLALADGVKPDVDSYLTMQAWLNLRHFETTLSS